MKDFYNNLSTSGTFFFWITIFLFIFVIFLVIILILKNKKLAKYLKETTTSNVETKEKSINEDNITIDNLNTDNIILTSKEIKLPLEDKEEIKLPPEDKQPPKEEKKEIIENGLYKKNVLRDTRRQTSPISINNINNITTNTNNNIDKSYISNTSPLEELEDIYETNDSMKFASDIVDKMEEEIKPSNIELTEYEKKQEEEAIISYDELLKVKDKIYNITDDEETDEFIDELKNFRIDLQ